MESTKPVYSVVQIRQIEAAFETQFPHEMPLMQRAGQAIAEHICTLLQVAARATKNSRSQDDTASRRPKIAVLAGNGNNGGDGIVAASAIQRMGIETVIVFAMSRSSANAIKHPLAQAAFVTFTASGGAAISLSEAIAAISAGEITLIVDALFGIGLRAEPAAKPIDSALYSFISHLNSLRETATAPTVVAVDLPSGIDAETGAPCLRALGNGSTAVALMADETLTFIGHKAGLHTGDGVDYAGRITCFDLQIPKALFPKTTAHLFCNATKNFSRASTKRNVHKGTFGTASIIGGAPGMLGAGWLAARAALLCGAGKTMFMQLLPDGETTDSLVDPIYPEIMHSAINITLETPYFRASTAIGIGPGLGHSNTASTVLATVLQQQQPLIIDADALTLIAKDPNLAVLCHARQKLNTVTVLTPHPREAAILLGCSTIDVQQNRVIATQKIAQKFNAIVVLKGAGSITADAHDNVFINQSGNPGMASGGMGDVLTGMLCAAFCLSFAQKSDDEVVEIFYARHTKIVANTVWLHGHAADCCVARGIGPVGLRASEVAEQARALLNGGHLNG